jgi:glycosyltransferase involved in cell wall biosynthesis
MGIVAIEAMACGRCVIGSAGGGLGEVLEGVCPTFPNGDATALADRLVTVLTDPAARASHERAARRRSGDFSLPRVSGQYVEYLTDILTPSGRRA